MCCEDPPEMGAVVEAAGEGDVGYRPVSCFWSAQQVLGAIQTLGEDPLHHGFPTLSEYPMQKACGDAEFARQGLPARDEDRRGGA